MSKQLHTEDDEFDGCAREWIRGSTCDPSRPLTDDDRHRIWQLAELLRRWFGGRLRVPPPEALAAPFFSFSNSGGFDAHKTLAEAKERAQNDLDCERDYAGDDGWSEDDTTSICYGVILGGVEETERMPWHDHLRRQGMTVEDGDTPRFDEFVDYEMKHYADEPAPQRDGGGA